jgi:hypothetical protein
MVGDRLLLTNLKKMNAARRIQNFPVADENGQSTSATAADDAQQALLLQDFNDWASN